MKYFIYLPALLLLAATTGCGNASDEESTTTPANTSTMQPATISTGGDTARTQTVQVQPAADLSTQVNSTNQPPAPVISKAGLNPAHGQPGHRCDIQVGAPLDSKPTQATVNTNPQPATITSTPSPAAPVLNTNTAPGATAAGLNPAHGQPGHRCDIAVGAPLNSKPTQ
ncbi:MAG: hypothetical protein IPQ25_12675 [Chitinophagaceae bacterium]|nr:hypothetical protein [Chitinophagaceae bacterium]